MVMYMYMQGSDNSSHSSYCSRIRKCYRQHLEQCCATGSNILPQPTSVSSLVCMVLCMYDYICVYMYITQWPLKLQLNLLDIIYTSKSKDPLITHIILYICTTAYYRSAICNIDVHVSTLDLPFYVYIHFFTLYRKLSIIMSFDLT